MPILRRHSLWTAPKMLACFMPREKLFTKGELLVAIYFWLPFFKDMYFSTSGCHHAEFLRKVR